MRLQLDRFLKTALVVAMSVGMAGSAIAATRPDPWVTTKVKISLLTGEGISSRDVNVDTIDGRVTLHGVVGSAAEKARAEQVARGVSGVREVRNLLQVVPPSTQKAIEVSDAQLKDRVADALKADKALVGSSIKVQSVTAGVVLLSGSAKTLTDVYRALDDAAAVDGVRRVATEIRSPDELADAEMWREGGYDADMYSRSTARDLWITTATKMRLLANADTPAFDINVDTEDGVVTLFGMVDADRVKQQAGDEARKVGGVRQVVNALQVVPPSRSAQVKHADKDLQQAIEQRFGTRDALSDSAIDVEVSDGVARLSGTIKTRGDQVTALTLARSTVGVRRVIDDLRLDTPTPPVSAR